MQTSAKRSWNIFCYLGINWKKVIPLILFPCVVIIIAVYFPILIELEKV